MKYIFLVLFSISIYPQSEFLLLMQGDDGIGEYPITTDLIHSYDEREMTVSSWQDQTGTYRIATCVFNNTSSVFSVNGSDTTNTSGAYALNGSLFLCSNNGGSNNFGNYEVVAIYLHSTAHDLATRTAIINWLNSKYGVF